MKEKKKKNKKKIIIVSVSTLLVIGLILYGLADRYLIEHVSINNAFDKTELQSDNDTDTTNSLNNTNTNSSDNTNTDSSNNASTNSSNDVTNTSNNFSYKSDSYSVKITPKTTGTGDNRITYYVADVVISDTSNIKAAFAKNEFGTNIVEYTSTIAKENNAVFAINGDYYGFRNDGIVIRNGKIFRDSPVRTGLAIYSDGRMTTYDETETTAKDLVADGVIQTLSFGPVLVKNSTAITNFQDVMIDSNFGNRTIENSNPRTGIGVISENHYVFIVVDGRSRGYSKGMTLAEFAKVFEDLGCTDAYNLDGGGSSTMYFNGKIINNPLGRGKERGVSDILYLN